MNVSIKAGLVALALFSTLHVVEAKPTISHVSQQSTEPDAAPVSVTNVVAVFDPATQQSKITWSAPTLGQDGKTLNNPVSYSIRKKGSYDVLASDIQGTEYIDEVNLDKQTNSAYYVTAYNETGKSSEVKSNDLIIGKPYELPFAESAPNGVLTNNWLVTRTGSSRWGASDLGSISYDNDRGYITFCPLMEYDASTITSGYIHVAEAANPVLRFHYFYVMPTDDQFYVTITTENGEEIRIWEYDYESDNSEQWYEVDLALKDYAPEAQYVQVAFHASLGAATMSILYIDDITMIDKKLNDVSLTLVKAPRNLKPGEPRSAIVRYENLGTEDVAAGAGTIRVVMNEKPFAAAPTPKVPAGKRLDITLDDLTLDVFDTSAVANLYFEVVMQGDEQPANNCTETISLEVKPSYLYSPVDVKMCNNVLTWSDAERPTHISETYTESFEDAPSFTIDDFGEWSMFDGLNTSVYGLSTEEGDISFPNTCMPQAWTVLDYASGLFNNTVEPKTGNKQMAAFSHAGTTADSWLISPELSGEEQTIQLYAKAISSSFRETLDILFSLDASMNLGSFEELAFSKTNVNNSWKQYSFELPEGSRYFAIRCVSYDALCLLVDDVTYIPEALGQSDVNLLGYNVYCDGVKINDHLLADQQFYINDMVHTYNVTAVYSAGESKPSANAVESDNAIETVRNDASQSVDYNLSGVRVDAQYKGIVIRKGSLISK